MTVLYIIIMKNNQQVSLVVVVVGNVAYVYLTDFPTLDRADGIHQLFRSDICLSIIGRGVNSGRSIEIDWTCW